MFSDSRGTAVPLFHSLFGDARSSAAPHTPRPTPFHYAYLDDLSKKVVNLTTLSLL